MARTISAGYASGVTLAPGDDPVTVTATGSIGATDAAALLSSGTADRTITNDGTIAAAGSGVASVGVQLKNGADSAGGTIVNNGTIAGGQFGIYSNQAVTLANAGTIGATAATSGVAVVLGTGRVDNAGGITGARYGIYMIGAGAVTNAGTITGTTNAGVVLNVGGTLTNSAPSARIAGARIGVYLYGLGTVANAGTIAATGTASYGAMLKAGGIFTNQPSGSVTGTAAGVVSLGTVAATISNAGAIQGSSHGVGVANAVAAVQNAAGGQITGIGGSGVLALAGGGVDNAGTVTGRFGIRMLNAVGTVTNSGSVASTGRSTPGLNPESVGAGVQLGAGGTIVNDFGARISGFWIGAQIGNFNGTNANGGAILNAGVITANDPGVSGAAVWMKGEGLISNAATGTIGSGPYGIVSYNKVTIVNRGTIFGTDHAVFTSAVGNGDRIIVYPGASFGGTVMGDAVAAPNPTGVLQLGAGGAGGTITGFGSKYIGFARVEVDAGATWSLAGTVVAAQTIALSGPGAALTLANPGSVAGTITGFAPSTQLVLGGITDITASSVGAGNVLSLTRASGGTIRLAFDAGTSLAGGVGFAADGSGTTLSAPCFAAGTHIATPHGEVAVEALAIGDAVLRARGGEARIVWIGHRRVDCRRHPNPAEVWPVRVAAGAFGRGVPARDLWLSPDHAVFAAGVLVPVQHLVNGRTIRQEPVDAITYFHVELEAHDVLLAEALPCESYLDTGNRAAFANGGAAALLQADFARGRWAASGCAPLVEGGEVLAGIRSRLLARAGALGHRRAGDPALVVRVDGVAVALDPAARWHDIALPAGAATVALCSRVWVPAQVDPRADDTRRLGVAIGELRLDGARVGAADARLAAGWHAPEGALRWTDGAAWLHPRGARRLGFAVAMAGQYWAEAAPARAAG
jgi:hypothetical protein